MHPPEQREQQERQVRREQQEQQARRALRAQQVQQVRLAQPQRLNFYPLILLRRLLAPADSR